jgi:hypothetical protein
MYSKVRKIRITERTQGIQNNEKLRDKNKNLRYFFPSFLIHTNSCRQKFETIGVDHQQRHRQRKRRQEVGQNDRQVQQQ